MAFGFFKREDKGPRTVTCPLCQHSQQESPLAVSSLCKGCNAYLSFRKDGEIIARPSDQPKPFISQNGPAAAPGGQSYLPQKDLLKSEDTPLPSSPLIKVRSSLEAKPLPESPRPAPPIRPQKPKHEPKPPSQFVPEEKPAPTEPIDDTLSEPEEPAPRYQGVASEEEQTLNKKALPQRFAVCFECGESHLANALANSTQCHHCGRLISLKDQHIKESHSSSVQTRGDVFIYKKGVVHGANIQCHHLIVEGEFTGDAQCSGDLTLRRHGKIIGKVACHRLLVERRAKVDFAQTVVADECLINGIVSGNLICKGRLALEKRATFTGDIKVGSLTVADGAKHTGQIQMGQF